MDNYIDLKKLNLDELVGVVNLYPWFGGARKQLCERMTGAWGEGQLSDAALYVGSRKMLSGMFRESQCQDCTDADVQTLLKSYIPESDGAESESSEKRKVYVVGGDFFSQEDYDKVRTSEDNIFSAYAARARQERVASEEDSGADLGIYTETLAEIYASQGYYDQAIKIYSKLILAYPEKNTYFATLIEKLKKIKD